MGQIKTFEELTIWQQSRDLVNLIYKVTTQTTFSKDYQLVNHLRKTAISIPSNIAEGFERDGNKEFVNFLSIAKGSCGELRCQLYLALDQDYLPKEKFDNLNNQIKEIGKSISSLIRYLNSSDYQGNKFKR